MHRSVVHADSALNEKQGGTLALRVSNVKVLRILFIRIVPKHECLLYLYMYIPEGSITGAPTPYPAVVGKAGVVIHLLTSSFSCASNRFSSAASPGFAARLMFSVSSRYLRRRTLPVQYCRFLDHVQTFTDSCNARNIPLFFSARI